METVMLHRLHRRVIETVISLSSEDAGRLSLGVVTLR